MAVSQKSYVIGLVGPLASGKSAVSVECARLGAAVLDADRAVHSLQQADTAVTSALSHAFGPDILDAQGAVSRPALAQKIIQDPDRLSVLESLIYPALRAHIRAWLSATSAPVVILEAPLLFEAELHTLCDDVMACLCSSKVRYQRALQREGMTDDKYKALVGRQKTNEELMVLSRYHLDTETDIAHTLAQVQQWMKEWMAYEPL